MKTKILLSIFTMTLAICGHARAPGDPSQASSIEKKLKPIVQEWERPDRPGGVIVVMDQGDIIYKRCFGKASVEYQIPNTPQTVFDACSIAEVITGMAVAMLEEDGKLSPAENIKKYIPELSSCVDSITIAHLLYHTSGLIDWLELVSLAGWNEEDVINFDHILRLLEHQEKLLFEPGSKYLHSRTNYCLLAELVKRITGQSFRDWTWENIFKPLGMTRTIFRDNHREIVENRAYSINYHYRYGYLKGADNMSVIGSNSLYTTLDDIIEWIRNFQTPKVGSTAVTNKMVTSGKLSDGKDAGHSYGFLVDTHRGLKRIHKNGAWAGFRSAFHYYPDFSFAVVVFTNWDYEWNNPVSLAENVAFTCLKSHMKAERKPKLAQGQKKKKKIDVSPSVLGQYEGDYRLQPRTYLKVVKEDKNLVMKVSDGQQFQLIPTSEDEFLLENQNISVSFQRDKNGRVSFLIVHIGPQEMTAPKIDRVDLNREQLKLYEGSYHNEELDARYEISLRDRGLVLRSPRGRDVVLTPENRESFAGNSPFFNLISFLMDENEKIIGFQIEKDHLRHFFFKKKTK